MAAALSRRAKRALLATLALLVLLGVIWAGLALVFDFITFKIGATEMWPTLGPGARVLINKWREPRRGDVVALRRKDKPGYVLMRVVGLPGDHVEFRDLRPHVAGMKAEWTEVGSTNIAGREQLVWRESFAGRSYLVLDDVNRHLHDRPAQTAEGYWLLGDNREYLLGEPDRMGTVTRERIRGVVTWVFDEGQVPHVRPKAP